MIPPAGAFMEYQKRRNQAMMTMMTWVLILFFHVGPCNAVTNVPGFISIQECQAAGNQAKTLANGIEKASGFVCVQQTTRK